MLLQRCDQSLTQLQTQWNKFIQSKKGLFILTPVITLIGGCATPMWSTRPVFRNRQFAQSGSRWITVDVTKEFYTNAWAVQMKYWCFWRVLHSWNVILLIPIIYISYTGKITKKPEIKQLISLLNCRFSCLHRFTSFKKEIMGDYGGLWGIMNLTLNETDNSVAIIFASF